MMDRAAGAGLSGVKDAALLCIIRPFAMSPVPHYRPDWRLITEGHDLNHLFGRKLAVCSGARHVIVDSFDGSPKLCFFFWCLCGYEAEKKVYAAIGVLKQRNPTYQSAHRLQCPKWKRWAATCGQNRVQALFARHPIKRCHRTWTGMRYETDRSTCARHEAGESNA